LHEPGELSQWLSLDDSTINVVLVTIIIIFIFYLLFFYFIIIIIIIIIIILIQSCHIALYKLVWLAGWLL